MIKNNPKFKRLYSTTCRYILLTGGRAGAKSFEASAFAVCLTFEQYQKILFTRYTMTSAELSIIPEFKGKIELLEVPLCFKVGAADITNIETKVDIIFRGIKTSSGIQTANLKSIEGVATWILDEAEELRDEEIFNTIDLSIRTVKAQNTIIIIMNPSDKDHWVHKRFIANTCRIEFIDGYPVEISTHPDVLHIHTTYLDNIPNLDTKYVENLRKLKDSAPNWYGHKIIGQWSDVAEGAIYPSEKLKYFHEADEMPWDSSIAYIDVADEGTDFLCMVIGKTVGTRICITDVVFSDQNADVTIPMCVAALKSNGVSYVRVESNSMGAMYGRSIQAQLDACEVLFVNNGTNKHTRILMEAPFIYEYCYFKLEAERDAMYHAFMLQLFRYTKDGKADHDDAADATCGLTLFARGYLQLWY